MANCDIIPTTHHFGDDTSQIKWSPSILTLGHQQEIPRLSVSQRQSGWETLRKLWTANYEPNPQDIPKWLSKAAWSRNCWVWLFFPFFCAWCLYFCYYRGETDTKPDACLSICQGQHGANWHHSSAFAYRGMTNRVTKGQTCFLTTVRVKNCNRKTHENSLLANLPLLWTQSEQSATFLENKENSWAVLNSTHYQDLHFCGPTGYKLMNHIHHCEI